MQPNPAQSVLERSSLGGTWNYDVIADHLVWSEGTFRVWGYDPKGKQPTAMESFACCTPESKALILAAVQTALRDGTSWDLELDIVTVDDRHRRVRSTGEATFENGRPVQLYGSYVDIGERLRMVQENQRIHDELKHQAKHDGLTGLPNRDFVHADLELHIERAHNGGPSCALLYLDLDRFKLINDSCGHMEGNRLLCEVAAVLGAQKRDGDVLARLGGDEFAIVLNHCTPLAAAAISGGLIATVAALRFKSGGASYPLSLSIGIAMIDANTVDVAEVISQADTACFVAKDCGRGRFQMYQRSDQEVASTQRDIDWAARLEDALERNRIELFGQRIVSLDAGALPSYEILVRLRGDNGALIAPGVFLPAAQRFGLMAKIDRYVVQRAFAKIAALENEGDSRYGYLSLNLSGTSISDPEFARFLLREVEGFCAPPQRVRFEITESAAIYEHSGARDFLARLRAAGFKILLDDFGTGFTSFNYLKTLGVDGIKIDQSFTRELVNDETNLVIVEALCLIATRLGLDIIAEGVEDQTTLDALAKLGVRHIQGWLFHKAEPLDHVLLATSRLMAPLRAAAAQ